MSMEATIKSKISAALKPQVLEITNDSARHAGHAGDNGTGESHFKLKIVSAHFEGLGRVERQKLVYNILAHELASSLHALSIKALTPPENDKM